MAPPPCHRVEKRCSLNLLKNLKIARHAFFNSFNQCALSFFQLCQHCYSEICKIYPLSFPNPTVHFFPFSTLQTISTAQILLFSTLPGFRSDDLELEYLPEITSRGLSLATRRPRWWWWQMMAMVTMTANTIKMTMTMMMTMMMMFADLARLWNCRAMQAMRISLSESGWRWD